MNKKQIKEAKKVLYFEICLAFYKYADKRYQAHNSPSNARRLDLARHLLLKHASTELRKKIDSISFNAYESINDAIKELY